MFNEFQLLTPEEEFSFVQQTTLSLSLLMQGRTRKNFKRTLAHVSASNANETRQKCRKPLSQAEKKLAFLEEFVVLPDEYVQDDTEYRPESELPEEPPKSISVKKIERKRKPLKQSLTKGRKLEKTMRRSKNQSRIWCNHCKTFFFAKPTLRKKKHVFALNHSCRQGEKRRQYVLGKKHRKCEFVHEGPCLELAPE